MKKTCFALLSLVSCGLFALGLGGCDKTAENNAQAALVKFEHVFQVCKEETIKKQMEPGKHVCAKVSSIALDKTLRDTGIGDSALAKMRDEWVKQKGFEGYYIPEAER